MSRRILVWTALVVVFAVSATMAGPIDLHAVEYPEKATVSLNLSPEPGAPNAKMQAKVAVNASRGIWSASSRSAVENSTSVKPPRDMPVSRYK